MPNYTHAYYLEKLIKADKLKKQINLAAAALQARRFDTIAFRGMSGAILGPSLAMLLNKHMLMVRKPSELQATHSPYRVEGHYGVSRYVIVDDFVSSGSTVRHILEDITRIAPKAKCIGILEVDKLTKYNVYQTLGHIDENGHFQRGLKG